MGFQGSIDSETADDGCGYLRYKSPEMDSNSNPGSRKFKKTKKMFESGRVPKVLVVSVWDAGSISLSIEGHAAFRQADK